MSIRCGTRKKQNALQKTNICHMCMLTKSWLDVGTSPKDQGPLATKDGVSRRRLQEGLVMKQHICFGGTKANGGPVSTVLIPLQVRLQQSSHWTKWGGLQTKTRMTQDSESALLELKPYLPKHVTQDCWKLTNTTKPQLYAALSTSHHFVKMV